MMDVEKETHQPDSLVRNLEAMMKMETPTAKTETQPKEEEAAKEKGTGAIQKKNQHEDKNICIREDIEGANKIFPPRQQTGKMAENMKKRERATTRTHSMGRHRANRIQSASRQMGMPIRRLPTNHG